MSPRYVPAPPPRDPRRGTVHVITKDGRMPKRIEQLVDERTARKSMTPANMPHVDRRYLVAGGQLSRLVEVEAMRVGALPVLLPAGGPWLATVITECTGRGRDVLLWVKGAGEP